MEQHHDNHLDEFNSEWAKAQSNSYISRLKTDQDLFETPEQKQEFAQAFKPEGQILNRLKCSDGRVGDDEKIPGDESLKTAGENILFSAQQLEEFVDKYKGQIKVVTSHEGCGAAALKFKQMLEAGEALPDGVTTSDELGMHFSAKLALKLGAEYQHITKEKFCCPVHNERMLVLDGTARFNANKIKDFPPRFISAALGLGENQDYIRKEAEILSGIALGDHGFNERFSAENPFYLVIVAKDQAQLTETEELLAPFEQQMAGRVKIKGVLEPQA